MSKSLVRKGLEIVDSTHSTGYKQGKEVFELVPQNQKVTTKRHIKGGKVEKVNRLSHKNKITIIEAKRNFKTKDQILKENLKKLKLIEKACKITLDKDTVNQIINRAVTKRPVKKAKKHKKDNKTAFTEEDFKKFEDEYFDE